MCLGNESGVFGQHLFTPLQTRAEVFDGLRVVFVFDGELSKGLEGVADPRVDFVLPLFVCLLGFGFLKVLRLLDQDVLGQLQHLPGQLQVGRLVFVLLLGGSYVALFSFVTLQSTTFRYNMNFVSKRFTNFVVA